MSQSRTNSYDDIIDLPHHTSTKHPRMTMRQRAAQFAPFAALTGYGAAVNETARLTEQAVSLDEDTLILLDERLHTLLMHPDEKPVVTVTCFVPDERKDGGRYVEMTGVIKRYDEYEQSIALDDGSIVKVKNIVMIDGDYFLKVNRAAADM